MCSTGDFVLAQEMNGHVQKAKIYNRWTLFESNDFGKHVYTILCYEFSFL